MNSHQPVSAFCLTRTETETYGDLFHTMDGPCLTKERICHMFEIPPGTPVRIDVKTEPPGLCTCQGAEAIITVYVFDGEGLQSRN